MNLSRSRILFFLFAIGLVSFSLYDNYQKENKKEREQVESLIFQGKVQWEDIQQVFIQKADQISLKLVKKEKQWRLEEPLKDVADSIKVEGLIQQILSQSVMKVSDERINWSSYGLDSPASNVVLVDQKGNNLSVGLSNQMSFDRQFFLKKEDTLLLGSNEWESIAQVWEDDFRNKKLLIKKDLPSQIVFQTNSKNYKLKRGEGELWEWERSQTFPVSNEKVGQFLSFLNSDRVQDFSVQEKKEWSQPDLTVQMNFDENSWKLELKNFKEKNAQVVVSDRNYILELDATNTEELLTMDFEDRHFPFRWDASPLHQIEFVTPENRFELIKEKGNWEVKEPFHHEIHSQNLSHFLKWLDTLEAEDRGQEPKDANFEYQIFLKSDTGELLLQLYIDLKKERAFVKTSLESKEVYFVNKKTVQDVIHSSIVEKQK